MIEEGEDGDELFVVEEGELECTKKNKETGTEDYLISYNKGMAFGELALLYNAPRAATIKSTTKVSLYSLDRETFNHIVKNAVTKKR